MHKPSSINWLVPLVAILALVTALAGLFWPGAGDPRPFTTLHGQEVELAGYGLYQNDTRLFAAGFRGTDAVTLVVSIPLLLISFALYRRGSLRGGLLLTGALTLFVYYSVSLTFSAQFNPLFLVYTALFSASLFAFIRAFTLFDVDFLAAQISPRLPRRAIAVFMFIAGLGTLFLWLSELLGPIFSGQAPENLGPYTTMFTHGLDSAIITPAAVLTGVYLLRRAPLGYLLGSTMLILCTVIGVIVLTQTLFQAQAGVIFPIGVYIGMVGSWVVMGIFSVWLLISFFRNVREAPASPADAYQAA
jgi:hypothetical protein